MKSAKRLIAVILVVMLTVCGIPAQTANFFAMNTIESISAVANTKLIENADGFFNSYYDNITYEEHKYFCYSVSNDMFEYTVTYGGGNVITGDYQEIYDMFGQSPTVLNSISPDDQWGVGKHNVQIILLDAQCQGEIEVVENPIESISAVCTKSLVENFDGYMSVSFDYLTGTTNTFFRYDVSDNMFIYTVTYDGGKTFTGDDVDVSDKFDYYYPHITDPQSYENQWGIGTHNVEISFMGVTGNANVEVVKNPIESISAVATENFIENVDGYTYSYSDNDEEYEFYKYDVSNNLFEYTVTYADGQTFTGKGWEVSTKFGFFPEVSDDQSYDNQWGVGTHKVKIEFMGITGEADIEVVKNPIESILVVANKRLVENVDGYTDTYFDGDEEHDYYRYDVSKEMFEYTITYDGGKIYTGDSWGVISKFGYYMEISDNQAYDNQWGVGTHTVEISLMGVTIDAEVEVVENYIESISAVAIYELIEDVDGYTDTYFDGDNEYEYFRYDVFGSMFDLTVTYDGGQTFTGKAWEVSEKFDYFPQITDLQSYENQWGIGTHKVEIEFMGLTTEADIEVVDNPIESVSAVAVKSLYENISGYSNTYYDGDDEYKYFVYDIYSDMFEYTITYDGGKTFTGEDWEVNEKFDYYPNVFDLQDYDNQWGVGTHTVEVYFMGVTEDAEIEVVESPVKSVSAVCSRAFTADIDGFNETDTDSGNEFIRYDVYGTDFIYTVVLKDNTEIMGDFWIISDYFVYGELDCSVSYEQDYNNQWGIGKHPVSIEFLGKTIESEVEIAEPQYKGIRIKENNLTTVEFIKTDDSIVEAKIIGFHAYAGSDNGNMGSLSTDKGVFPYEVSYDFPLSYKNIKFKIGPFTSNVLDEDRIAKVDTISSAAFSYLLNPDNAFISFDGEITEENIDDIIMLSKFATDYDYSLLYSISMAFPKVTCDMEDVKGFVSELFDIDGVDFTTSSYYDSESQQFILPTSDMNDEWYDVIIENVSEDGGWIATPEESKTVISIAWDSDGHITKMSRMERELGDVDLSGGTPTISDALTLFKHVAGVKLLADANALAAADVDGNKSITIADALQLFKYVAGVISEL